MTVRFWSRPSAPQRLPVRETVVYGRLYAPRSPHSLTGMSRISSIALDVADDVRRVLTTSTLILLIHAHRPWGESNWCSRRSRAATPAALAPVDPQVFDCREAQGRPPGCDSLQLLLLARAATFIRRGHQQDVVVQPPCPALTLRMMSSACSQGHPIEGRRVMLPAAGPVVTRLRLLKFGDDL